MAGEPMTPCKDCIYAVDDRCRRHAPTVILVNDQPVTIFPQADGRGCGEGRTNDNPCQSCPGAGLMASHGIDGNTKDVTAP